MSARGRAIQLGLLAVAGVLVIAALSAYAARDNGEGVDGDARMKGGAARQLRDGVLVYELADGGDDLERGGLVHHGASPSRKAG